ncbi:MAG: tetratricopeptide repeat protein [Dehalococcoidia bacterium]
MSFASPALLSLLALAPLAGLGFLYLARWRQQAGERFALSPASQTPDLSPSPWRRGLKATLLVAAVALVSVAAARPRIGEEEVLVQQEGVELVIALDVSESMLVEDAAPDRLGHAQSETQTLLERLRGDRVGLVLFARSAMVRSPLTTDMGALSSLVDRAGRDAFRLLPGSDLGEGIRAAREALAAGEAESQAILLVSDGEDHAGGAVDAARETAREGITLHAAGVGTARGGFVPLVIPETGQTIPKSDIKTGEPILSRADEGLLRRLAEAGGGDFISLTGEAMPLAGLSDDLRELRQTLFAAESEERPIERFQPFLLAALALLALEMLIPERRGASSLQRRWLRWAPLPSLLLMLAAGTACGSAAVDFNRDGNDLYDRGSYEEALESYRRAQALQPDREEFRYNAGNALHRLELYGPAIEEALRALPADDPALAARVHYNLGNHYFRLGSLSEALEEYKQALLLAPDDEDAKYNMEVVQQQLALQLSGAREAAGEEGVPGGVRPQPGRPGPTGEGTPGMAVPGEEGTAPEEPGREQQLQRDLAEALAGIDEDFTIAEALRVLELVEERSRLRAGEALASPPQPGGPPDY